MMNILNQTREEVYQTGKNILWNNQTNNKVTNADFKDWTEEDKQFILSLMHYLGYFEYKNTSEYFAKIIKVFYEVNNIVEEYNRPITNDFQKLQVYALSCKKYFQENDDFTKEEQDKIVKRYKTYRGMAKLKDYKSDLENLLLTNRTQQFMMENEFLTYLDQPEHKENRRDIQKKAGIEITQTLNHAS